MRITIETEQIVATAIITGEQLAAINKIINPEPKEYKIFFAQGDDKFTEKILQYREYAGTVLAKDLDEAFDKSQNGNDKEWELLSRRSTSVGDFISDGENMYMVASQGFTFICKVSVDSTFDTIHMMNEQLAMDNERECDVYYQMQMIDELIQQEEETKLS